VTALSYFSVASGNPNYQMKSQNLGEWISLVHTPLFSQMTILVYRLRYMSGGKHELSAGFCASLGADVMPNSLS